MTIVSALLAGLVFGIGLIVSGMSDPSKVLGFLDLAGRWDPSLALVMAAAVTVALPAFGWAGRRTRSILGEPMQLPPAGGAVDRRLLLGAALFGVGWGVAGLCPGPALVVLGMAEPKAVVFVLGLLLGMALFEWLEARRADRAGAAPAPTGASLQTDISNFE